MSLVAGSALVAGMVYNHLQTRSPAPTLQLSYAGAGFMAPRMQLAEIQLLQSCACTLVERAASEAPAAARMVEPAGVEMSVASAPSPLESSEPSAAQWIDAWSQRMALLRRAHADAVQSEVHTEEPLSAVVASGASVQPNDTFLVRPHFEGWLRPFAISR